MRTASLPNAFSRTFKRRSARIQLKIRISIVIGDESVLDAETTTVSKHGARIRVTSTRGRLAHGERLRVAVHKGQKPQPARVVWLDKRSAEHFGIELDEDPGNFWGVYFPSKDGELRGERKEAPGAEAVASAAAAVQPRTAGQVAVGEPPVPESRRRTTPSATVVTATAASAPPTRARP
jgi:hypothetical protein